jgi:hypothetical protein
MSKLSFDRFRTASDAMEVLRTSGEFMVFTKDGKFFVATKDYPGGGGLPSGQMADEFSTAQEAIEHMRWLDQEYS